MVHLKTSLTRYLFHQKSLTIAARKIRLALSASGIE